jgi:hypothetical protein
VLPFKPLVIENRDPSLEMGMAGTLTARLSSSAQAVEENRKQASASATRERVGHSAVRGGDEAIRGRGSIYCWFSFCFHGGAQVRLCYGLKVASVALPVRE